MNSTKIAICLAGLGAALWSCVREDRPEVCPPDGTVVVAVKDKNYDNAAEAGMPVIDEALPMLSYVNSLVLRNRAVATDTYTVYDETLAAGETVHPVDGSRFAEGENDMTAVANSATARQYVVAGAVPVTLHPDATENEDVYMGHEEITYRPEDDRTIWLYRTKGLLVVEPENMPENVKTMAMTIGRIYATAQGAAGGIPAYGGETTVRKSFDVGTTAAGTRYTAMLAPSVAGGASTLEITFTFADGTTESVTMEVAMARNHITLVKPKYDTVQREWTIEVMIDGNWVKIENLNITD